MYVDDVRINYKNLEKLIVENGLDKNPMYDIGVLFPFWKFLGIGT
jgi:hypothetical protein